MKSSLLLDEHPLLIMPKLATKIGLNESIVLQQIHYWNEINKKSNNNFRDGYYWTFNSYDQWILQFPFWSKKTIQRIITNLEKMSIVISGNYNKLKIDRTKWYRIDYEMLEELNNFPCGQNDLMDRSSWLHHVDELSSPLPETNSEITSETKKFKGTVKSIPLDIFLESCNLTGIEHLEEAVECIRYYVDMLHRFIGIESTYTGKEWFDMFNGIFDNDTRRNIECDVDILKEAIDKHFNTDYEHKEMYYLHNFKGICKDNRLYEAGIL